MGQNVNIDFAWIFIGIHVLLAFIYALFILTGRSRLKYEYLVLILFVPIVGSLVGLIAELHAHLTGKNLKSIDMLSLNLEEDILWKSLKNINEKGNLVPLEEALIINDNKTRREIILNALFDDPTKYLDILMVARHNDDTETSHYATAVITHTQRNFQLSIQKLSQEIDQNPDNLELLDKFINALDLFIHSGLLEEISLESQRMILSEALNKKLLLVPNDLDNLILKIGNHIELGDNIIAEKTLNLLKEYWPDEERTWIEALRFCYETNDQDKLKKVIKEIEEKNIKWSVPSYEIIKPWLRVV
jgi:hypothetical protein